MVVCIQGSWQSSYPRPDIAGFRVRDWWQLSVDPGSLGGHGKQGRDAEWYASWDRVLVEPEADPGDDDKHAARNVDGDQVVRKLSLED